MGKRRRRSERATPQNRKDTREDNARLDAARKKGMDALRRGDDKAMAEAIEEARSVIREMRHRERFMANIGESFSVGTTVPETGLYRHTACGTTEGFNKGNALGPCPNRNCRQPGASWLLQQK